MSRATLQQRGGDECCRQITGRTTHIHSLVQAPHRLFVCIAQLIQSTWQPVGNVIVAQPFLSSSMLLLKTLLSFDISASDVKEDPHDAVWHVRAREPLARRRTERPPRPPTSVLSRGHKGNQIRQQDGSVYRVDAYTLRCMETRTSCMSRRDAPISVAAVGFISGWDHSDPCRPRVSATDGAFAHGSEAGCSAKSTNSETSGSTGVGGSTIFDEGQGEWLDG